MALINISKDYNFNYTQDYSYNDDQIQIDAGKAKLFGTYSLNPYLSANESLIATALTTFTETSTLGTGCLIKYVLSVDNQAKYHDGTSWVNSTGVYAQSNLATELNSNVASLTAGRKRVSLNKVFLHSIGTGTLELDNLNISYSFSGYCQPQDIRGALINVPNNNVKDEQLATYIELADNEIDSYIGQQYTLPVTDSDTLGILRGFSINHAAYNVYGYIAAREDNGVSKFATAKYNQLIKKLEQIGNGTLKLIKQDDLTQYSNSTEGYSPTFNMLGAENWNVDADLLSDTSDGSFLG